MERDDYIDLTIACARVSFPGISRLPRRLSSDEEHEVSAQSAKPEKPELVLLFVSEPILGEIVSFRLNLMGYRVAFVTSQADFQSYVDRELPQLIAIDLDHPESDCLQMLEQLSANEITSHVPILCLSMEGDLGRAEQAYRAGARDFLVVPFNPTLLDQKLSRLLASPLKPQTVEV